MGLIYPDVITVGFTGSQHLITDQQIMEVERLVWEIRPKEVRHGDSIKSDAVFHMISMCCPYVQKIHLHIPENESKRAFCDSIPPRIIRDNLELVVWPAKPYLDRNKDIVKGSKIMIATPKEHEEQLRSGTWSTIRYAIKTKIRLIIVYPNGSVEKVIR